MSIYAFVALFLLLETLFFFVVQVLYEVIIRGFDINGVFSSSLHFLVVRLLSLQYLFEFILLIAFLRVYDNKYLGCILIPVISFEMALFFISKFDGFEMLASFYINESYFGAGLAIIISSTLAVFFMQIFCRVKLPRRS